VKPRVRTALLIALAGLLFGAATTYVSAWVLINIREPDLYHSASYRTTVDNTSGWYVRTQTKPGVLWVQCLPLNEEARGSSNRRIPPVPRWSLSESSSPSEAARELGVAERLAVWERAAGWPFHAVVDREAELYQSNRRTGLRCVTIRFERKEPYNHIWTGSAVPFTPLWPGFAINVVIFGVGWMIAVFGPIAIWRSMRRRPGRCGKCRYDLSGLIGDVCPECGNARPRRASDGVEVKED
jgi:hypothetical protein